MIVADVASGWVVERWEAPELLFEIAVDGDRVFGVSGTKAVVQAGDAGGILWELSADGPPREVLRLRGIAEGEMAIDRQFWNAYGALSVDPVLRRAIVSVPTSPEIVLFDLNTESVVARFDVALQVHGTAIDMVRGIGYASSLDGIFSFDLLTGAILDPDICPGALAPAAIAVASSANQIFVVVSPHQVCRYLPDLGIAEVIWTGCRDAPACYLAGADVEVGSVTGSTQQFFVVAAPGSDSIIAIDTAGSPPAEGVFNFAPHDFVSKEGSKRFVSMALCHRVEVSERNESSPVWDFFNISLAGDALGLGATDDGGTLFVTQADPDGPLGAHRWLSWEDEWCSEPIPKGED